MAGDKIRFLTGKESALPQTIKRGQVYFAVSDKADSGKIYFDAPIDANTTTRILMGNFAQPTWAKLQGKPSLVARETTSTTQYPIELDAAKTSFKIYRFNGTSYDSYNLSPNFLPLTGGTISGELYADSITTGSLVVNGDARFVNTIQGNINTSNKWATARQITIADADKSHSGTGVSVDGSAGATLLLPSTIKASFVGDLTGTASNATKVGHTLTYTKYNNGNAQTFNGSADIEIKPTYMDLHPIESKKYESTSYYASANDDANAAWYFLSVKPDAWYKPWSIKIKVHSYCPGFANVDSITYSTITGRADSVIYANWNERYDSGHYYIPVYPMKKAGFDAGYGHAIGVSIKNATNRTTSTYYRTFEIDLFECENCTVTFLTTPVKWSAWKDISATSVVGNTTNYAGINNTNAMDRGLQETGDANDYASTVSEYYKRIPAGTNGYYGYNILTLDTDGKLSGFVKSYSNGTDKTKNSISYQINAPFYYYNSGTTRASGAFCDNGQLRVVANLIDFRYSFNVASGVLTANQPVYLVGVLNNDYSSYTLADTWWTQTLPTTDDGKIYIYLGDVYPDSPTYRLSIGISHPIYWYKNGKVRNFNDTGVFIESAGTANQLLASSGGTTPTWVTPSSLSVDKANKWTTARNFTIADADKSNTGTAVSVDGSAAVTLVLPSTIKATLKGNADTASKLTNLTSADSASSTDTWRYVWFSYNDNTSGRPAYSNIFAYQSSTGTVKATKFQGDLTGNASSADKWKDKVSFTIADSDSSHTGTGVNVDGSAAVTLKLPSTIKATLNGNADTATAIKGASSTSAIPTTSPGAGLIKYYYKVNMGLAGNMPASSNANSILQINRHDGNYDTQLGFSSDGNIYYRSFINAAIDTTTAWKKLLDSNNYSTTLDTRYVKKEGDTLTGTLNGTAISLSGNLTLGQNSKFINNNTIDSLWSQDNGASMAVKGGISVYKQVSAKSVRIDNNNESKKCILTYNETYDCLEFVF